MQPILQTIIRLCPCCTTDG